MTPIRNKHMFGIDTQLTAGYCTVAPCVCPG